MLLSLTSQKGLVLLYLTTLAFGEFLAPHWEEQSIFQVGYSISLLPLTAVMNLSWLLGNASSYIHPQHSWVPVQEFVSHASPSRLLLCLAALCRSAELSPSLCAAAGSAYLPLDGYADLLIMISCSVHIVQTRLVVCSLNSSVTNSFISQPGSVSL